MMKCIFSKKLLQLGALHKATLIILGLLLFSALPIVAQNQHNFDKEEGIIIPNNIEMSNEMDFSLNDNFKNYKEAITYFRKYNTRFLNAKVDLEMKVVTLIFKLQTKPNWTVKEWNQHLEKIFQTNKK